MNRSESEHLYSMEAADNTICLAPPGEWDKNMYLFNTIRQAVSKITDCCCTAGFRVSLNGYYRYGTPKQPLAGEFREEQESVRYWTSDYAGSDSTRSFKAIHMERDSVYVVSSFIKPEWIYHPQFPGYIIGYKTPEACYVRCIRK